MREPKDKPRATRLLPWTGEDGKRCFLVTDDGEGLWTAAEVLSGSDFW
ncbi:hypothetical protein [Streptomyces sp. 2A115]